MYSEKVMEHFKNPRNMGEMKDADAVGEVGNPVCGDLMYIYIKVGKENGKEIIKDISFQTFGCAAAIATSS
ncbi:MAG: iron-sulfur cluster assembly scaffold protein, partial [Promethearchaeota archaeon]